MAEKKKAFDLGDVLKDVLTPDTGAQEQITYIALEKLDADAGNFYSLDGLDELAANIATVGLQQPLRVRPSDEPGRWLIVSGHRRRAALEKLADDEPERWGNVPCIIEPAAASPELQELRLIFANADTRKMTSFDQSKQAERVEELLYKLQEQGFEFPGRMRDHVAAACKVSATKIAVLKAIKVNLDRPIYEKYYTTGKINETVAYELAKQPVDLQRRICDGYLKIRPKLDNITAGFVADYAECAERFAKLKCPVQEGLTCTNCQKMLDKVFDGGYGYKACNYNNICCAKCSDYLNCKGRCPLMDDKAKAERAKKREASAAERAEQKQKADARITVIDRAWGRFGDALRRADMTDKQLRAAVKEKNEYYNPAETYMGEKKTEALLDGSCTEVKENDCTPFGSRIDVTDFLTIAKIADALDVSLDYLFLRDDKPRRETGLISVDDHYPDEGAFVIAYTKDLVAIPSVYFRAAFMDCTEKSIANNRLTGIEYWSPRPQLPAGKKWPGQETIEGMVRK